MGARAAVCARKVIPIPGQARRAHRPRGQQKALLLRLSCGPANFDQLAPWCIPAAPLNLRNLLLLQLAAYYLLFALV